MKCKAAVLYKPWLTESIDERRDRDGSREYVDANRS
jgi:hypothetical protein